MHTVDVRWYEPIKSGDYFGPYQQATWHDLESGSREAKGKKKNRSVKLSCNKYGIHIDKLIRIWQSLTFEQKLPWHILEYLKSWISQNRSLSQRESLLDPTPDDEQDVPDDEDDDDVPDNVDEL